MIILYASIIIFNILAFKTVKKLSGNTIVHIWVFTCAFQLFFDVFVDIKFQGYWYGTKGIDWASTPGYLALIPPVNLMFLNWFPFKRSIFAQVAYMGIWEVLLLGYEFISLLSEPWGFFHYGWWSLWYSAFVNPILLIILLGYYKLICKLEQKVSLKEPINANN